MNEKLVILGVFIVFGITEAIAGTLFKKPNETSDDWKVEIISSLFLFGITQPFILFAVSAMLNYFIPSAQGSLAHLNLLVQVALLLIFDDMTQYWWHRASHTFIPLYKLHRAHHNAKYMSVRIVYRNNLFYYMLMPSIWCSGVLVYLGLGWVYAGYLIVKLSVIIGAHSEWKWDRFLYKTTWLSPLAWLIERTISTPSTHSAHHGLNGDDGITNYKGNFGNLLFFWDVLFGTAKISRQYPAEYGVKGMLKADWKEQLCWPLFKNKKLQKSKVDPIVQS